MWGAFMVVGTRTACASLCQEVGEQITLACWRGPCAQGTFPALGNHVCTYNPGGAGGIEMRFKKGLRGKKFVPREVFV